MQQVESAAQMPIEQVPEDVMRLNIALTRLYEAAIRRSLEAEAEQSGQEEPPGSWQGTQAVYEEESIGEHATSRTL